MESKHSNSKILYMTSSSLLFSFLSFPESSHLVLKPYSSNGIDERVRKMRRWWDMEVRVEVRSIINGEVRLREKRFWERKVVYIVDLISGLSGDLIHSEVGF